jgi:hypothetical protein
VSQVKQMVSGNSARISKLLAELGDASLYPVRATPKGRSVIYEHVPLSDGDQS